jgi:hypothetical protein
MAVITSYATLQTAVADYLARSDLTSWIPNFIQNWEERFYRDSQNWAAWMESPLSVSISNGVAAVPADYLGLRIAYIEGHNGPPLTRISLEQLYARFPRAGSSGVPSHISRNGNNFEFGPIAGGGTLKGTYYAKPTAIRMDGDGVNWLITNAPDLCLYGALIEAEPFIKNDPRMATWQGLYDMALGAYRSQFREEDFSGSAPCTVVI